MVVVEAAFALKHMRSCHEVAELKGWLQTPETQHLKTLQMFCKTASACCPTFGNLGSYLAGTSSSSDGIFS